MIKKNRIIVSTKPDILDPAGVAVKKSIQRQNVLDVVDVRIGKVIDVTFKDGASIEQDEQALKKLAATILSNPIMEEFTIESIDESTDE